MELIAENICKSIKRNMILDHINLQLSGGHRVGSSGCAMVTLPYGQNFESKNVTVPPWREAVTFYALSAGINCW